MAPSFRPEESQNGAFTLKTHQMLTVFSTPEEFKNGTITAILDLRLSKIWALRKSPEYPDAIVFKIFRCQNVFSSRKNQKPALRFSNSSALKESSVLVTVLTEAPNQGKKAVLSNFSGMDTPEVVQNKFSTENRSYIIHLFVRAVFN